VQYNEQILSFYLKIIVNLYIREFVEIEKQKLKYVAIIIELFTTFVAQFYIHYQKANLIWKYHQA
jgi:hypothetical protein